MSIRRPADKFGRPRRDSARYPDDEDDENTPDQAMVPERLGIFSSKGKNVIRPSSELRADIERAGRRSPEIFEALRADTTRPTPAQAGAFMKSLEDFYAEKDTILAKTRALKFAWLNELWFALQDVGNGQPTSPDLNLRHNLTIFGDSMLEQLGEAGAQLREEWKKLARSTLIHVAFQDDPDTHILAAPNKSSHPWDFEFSQVDTTGFDPQEDEFLGWVLSKYEECRANMRQIDSVFISDFNRNLETIVNDRREDQEAIKRHEELVEFWKNDFNKRRDEIKSRTRLQNALMIQQMRDETEETNAEQRRFEKKVKENISLFDEKSSERDASEYIITMRRDGWQVMFRFNYIAAIITKMRIQKRYRVTGSDDHAVDEKLRAKIRHRDELIWEFVACLDWIQIWGKGIRNLHKMLRSTKGKYLVDWEEYRFETFTRKYKNIFGGFSLDYDGSLSQNETLENACRTMQGARREFHMDASLWVKQLKNLGVLAEIDPALFAAYLENEPGRPDSLNISIPRPPGLLPPPGMSPDSSHSSRRRQSGPGSGSPVSTRSSRISPRSRGAHGSSRPSGIRKQPHSGNRSAESLAAIAKRQLNVTSPDEEVEENERQLRRWHTLRQLESTRTGPAGWSTIAVNELDEENQEAERRQWPAGEPRAEEERRRTEKFDEIRAFITSPDIAKTIAVRKSRLRSTFAMSTIDFIRWMYELADTRCWSDDEFIQFIKYSIDAGELFAKDLVGNLVRASGGWETVPENRIEGPERWARPDPLSVSVRKTLEILKKFRNDVERAANSPTGTLTVEKLADIRAKNREFWIPEDEDEKKIREMMKYCHKACHMFMWESERENLVRVIVNGWDYRATEGIVSLQYRLPYPPPIDIFNNWRGNMRTAFKAHLKRHRPPSSEYTIQEMLDIYNNYWRGKQNVRLPKHRFLVYIRHMHDRQDTFVIGDNGMIQAGSTRVGNNMTQRMDLDK